MHAVAVVAGMVLVVAFCRLGSERVPEAELKKTAPVQAPKQSTLLEIIQQTNRQLAAKQPRPESMAVPLISYFPDATEDMLKGMLRDLGTAKGITAIDVGVARDHSWVSGKEHVAFTYHANGELLADAERMVNGYFGDNVFHPMLDGIRNDKQGPQIDFRGTVFPTFAGQLLVVVEKRPEQPSALMLAIPLTSTMTSLVALESIRRVDPLVRRRAGDPKGQRPIYVAYEGEKEPTAKIRWAATAVNKMLLVGDHNMVRAAMDRR